MIAGTATDPVSVSAACAICGSRASVVELDEVADCVTGRRFSIRRCSACTVARTEPQPVTIDEFYPPRYRRYGRATLAALTLLYRWRARGWSRRLGAPGVALEVGCGDGWMLQALRRRSWRVVGVERTVDSARFAALQQRLPVLVGDISALRLGSLDAVILFQVLEHLKDPLGVLRTCAGLLRPGGQLIISVPNIESWQARAFGARWFHLDVPRHRYHFSPLSLSRALEAAGLSVTLHRFVSPEHDPYGWLQSGLNRLGFKPNLLTRWLMGTAGRDGSAVSLLAMAAAGVPLGLAGIGMSLLSWVAGSGAIMEVWAVKK